MRARNMPLLPCGSNLPSPKKIILVWSTVRVEVNKKLGFSNGANSKLGPTVVRGHHDQSVILAQLGGIG